MPVIDDEEMLEAALVHVPTRFRSSSSRAPFDTRTPSVPLPHQYNTLIVDGSLQLAIITKLIISARQSGNKAPGRYPS